VTVAGVAVAGALGALARFGLSNVISSRGPRTFPTATFLINISGSFVLGLLAVLLTERFVVSASLRTSLTVGFLGAYTTFSTFSLETFRLLDDGAVAIATAYVVGSVALGVLAAYLGVLVARAG
jgi:fluoride exporter